MTSLTTRMFARTSAAAVAVGIGVLLCAPAAAAATPSVATPSVAAPSTSDVVAGHQAALNPTVLTTLGGFFAHDTVIQGGVIHGGVIKGQETPAMVAAEQAQTAPKVVGATVPVYSLNPKFVTASGPTVPVATVVFMATEAVSSQGQHASVWTARDARRGNAWTEVNIASGSDETDFAAQAAQYGVGTIAFYEPQIHAWYALHGTQVLPMNTDAVRSVGKSGVSLAAYQKLVHGRYANMMPGSAYDRKHMVGGMNLGLAQKAGPTSSGSDGAVADLVLGSAAGAALLGLLGVARWRRSGRTTA
jgi:hypothetical protein